jgi:hypothetical protein
MHRSSRVAENGHEIHRYRVHFGWRLTTSREHLFFSTIFSIERSPTRPLLRRTCPCCAQARKSAGFRADPAGVMVSSLSRDGLVPREVCATCCTTARREKTLGGLKRKKEKKKSWRSTSPDSCPSTHVQARPMSRSRMYKGCMHSVAPKEPGYC